jgi:cyclophilin family peptidyl-prolyl cis-trans isomerase/HEAT repeat protein
MAAAGRPAAAQGPQDEATVGLLARLLASADARRYDDALFRGAFQEPLPGVRRQAALAAGRIGDPAAVDLLVLALADSNQGVQAAAAFGLGLLKDARAVNPLLALVQSTAPDAMGAPQTEAVTAIAKIGGADGARALRQILVATSTPSLATRQALLDAWRLGALAPVSDILRFGDATDWTVRANAMYTLARLRSAQAVPLLLAGLQDREPLARAVAARGLTAALADSAKQDRRGVEARLRTLLSDPDWHIRVNALRALATFRDTAVSRAVIPLIGDAQADVAVQAETTLGVSGGPAAVAALTGQLTQSRFALRRQAILGLAQADSASGVAAAAALLTDPDWRWRSVAAEAFGGARDRGRLESLLGDGDGRVVAAALQYLEHIVSDSDAALLGRARRLLTHADPAVRSVAADVVSRHPDPADVPALTAAYQRAEQDPFDDARLSAVTALGRIAKASDAGGLAVASQFVSAVPSAADYLVRRLAADVLPVAAEAWGPATPIVTGRTDAEYRDVVRRYLLPALSGQAPPQVTIETEEGNLVVELYPSEAPLTVAAFLGLVDRHYFDGLRWHRVVPNFVVQDGDPRDDGWGGPGFLLRDEVNPIRYRTGTMGMALSGPDTGGSQYFITDGDEPHLDGIYTVFGHVVTNTRLLGAIAQGDRIRSIHR